MLTLEKWWKLGAVIRVTLLILIAGIAEADAATKRYYINFALMQNDVVINRGNDYATTKKHTWSRGMKRSYLKLSCDKTAPGKMIKLFSTVDHFAGLRVTHQLVEDRIELTVVRSMVQDRRIEIHDLPKDQCDDLAPVLTTVTETYSFPAKHGTSEVRGFGETMDFKFSIPAMGKAS